MGGDLLKGLLPSEPGQAGLMSNSAHGVVWLFVALCLVWPVGHSWRLGVGVRYQGSLALRLVGVRVQWQAGETGVVD